MYHHLDEGLLIDSGERDTTDLIERHPKGLVSFVLKSSSSVPTPEWLRTADLDHIRQKGLVIDDQALLRGLLGKPQATRINLGHFERLRTVSENRSAKISP